MCGKDFRTCPKLLHGLGSPPHVREGLYILEDITEMPRITPACAGRTGFLVICNGEV